MFQIGPREIGADLAFGVDLALFILQCGFHMIVRIFRVVPVVSNHVQTIGTIIWKLGFMLDKTQ